MLFRSVPRIHLASGGSSSGRPSVIQLVFREKGALTGPATSSDDLAIVRDFLGRHRDLFGLDAEAVAALAVIGDSPGGRSGLRMLRVEQRV